MENKTIGKNPLSDFIDDETYKKLSERGLINEKSVRDYSIRRKFRELRKNEMSAEEAIDLIKNDFPYLQFDTIRKIVYQIQR